MAFGAIAGLVGAAAGLYGANKNAKASEKIADSQNPYDIARANFQTNNVNRYTPFGSVEYAINEGRPNDPTDDTYAMQQTFNPQMQQLMDSMLGVAGRAPATFESSMPSGLRSKMAEVYGSDVPQSVYNAPVDGFGQARRPFDGQVHEGFNWKNYDAQGNKIDNQPYVPQGQAQGGGFGGGFGDPTTDQLLQITPGQTTNAQILDQLYNNGYINEYDYNTMQESFGNSGSGNNTGWSHNLPASEMTSWLPDDLHPRFRQTSENIFNAIAAYNPNTLDSAPQEAQTEPDVSSFDQQSLQALIQAMQGLNS